MKKKRLILSVLLSLVLLLSVSLTVLAIAPPDVPTPTIEAINVYRSTIDTNDQLYVIEYLITYGANPDEVVNEAFIFRLMDGATELKSTVAYPYQDDGYEQGIAVIYFSAAEVSDLGMGWIGAYTVNISGNPTLTWTGTGTPSVNSTTYEAWNDPMSTTLGADVLTLAQEFTIAWGFTATPLYVSTGGTTVLSALGEDYFNTSIPNLMAMQPGIFSSSIETAEYYERTHAETYATSIDPTVWAGSWIDDAIQPTVTALGISTNMAYGIIWAVLTLVIMGLIVVKTGFKFEILLLIGAVMATFGSLVNFVPMVVPVLIGALLAIFFVWKFFWNRSSA